MSTLPLATHRPELAFGIEILHSHAAVSEMPPEVSAAELMRDPIHETNSELVEELLDAAQEISGLVVISREDGKETHGLLDIFTAEQVLEMQKRVREYLGRSLEEHLADISSAPGYSYYIGRLATHFISSDDDVTTSFGSFVSNHIDPAPGARGPLERNSREYANWANHGLLKQFSDFYQTNLKFQLVGPTKPVEGTRVSWERGIAESQFLVLDYVRDLLSAGNSTRATGEGEHTMSLEDIEANLRILLQEKDRLVAESTIINPLLAEQLGSSIDSLRSYTIGVFHRGRMDVPRFKKEPANARAAVARVELLLVEAAAMSTTRDDQVEIPILDIE